MDRTHTKTILLIIASGVGGILLFIAVLIGVAYSMFVSSTTSIDAGSSSSRSSMTVASPPPIPAISGRFHGSQSRWVGGFPKDRSKILAAGNSQLVGTVMADEKPVAGIRLRLALNGSVMSQWTTSGVDGHYIVSVPAGKYRIDGYELDSSTTDKLLTGKADAPFVRLNSDEVITVDETNAGHALDLAYVDPVKKTGPFGKVSAAKPVVVTWEAHPGATTYTVQLVEQEDPSNYSNRKELFEWQQRPSVSATSFNIQDHGISLKKGFHYTVEICAVDSKNRTISESLRPFGKADFSVID